MEIKMSALIARIRRRLARDGESIHRTRGAQNELNLGEYYIVDVYRNMIEDTHIDPESLGRQLGALKPFEAVGSEN